MWYTVNNDGVIGCSDCSYEVAFTNLEYNIKNYPDEEWEMFEEEDKEV